VILAFFGLLPRTAESFAMSDKMRWRYGETNPVVAAVDAATEIECGDLVWLDGDDVKPASAQADQGSETANQQLAADKFLGVAMQRSRAGEVAPIRVATTGVFEFDCPSGTFELGDLVGIDENAAGNALLDQLVAKVAGSQYAIGRVTRRAAAAATTVLVDVRSTVMTGGVEGTSPAGV
jgi:predicted RecA/RadA family phage recombinase